MNGGPTRNPSDPIELTAAIEGPEVSTPPPPAALNRSGTPLATPAPTWNFSVVHAYGVPEIVDPEQNFRVLTRLVAHFEQHVDDPMYLDPEVGRPLSRGTVGLRIPITRFQTQIKMSLDKDPVSRQNVIDQLRRPGPYQDPALADDMERARAKRGE